VTATPRRTGRFAPFVAVGALGFAIDASILTALVTVFGWSNYSARAISFAAAVTATWLCNRRWVFERTPDARREYGTYLLTQIIGASINLGGFALLIEIFPALARMPVLPLAGGGILALLFNFFAARRWVFATPRPSPELPP
jgi:putative flippase GtrA